MHGCGNDYVYLNCMEKDIENLSSISKKLSNRHFGIGSDGLVAICCSKKADAKMRMFNADGSEGKMCGNAIRCVALFLNKFKINENKKLSIETLSGIKTVEIEKIKKNRCFAKVDMGKFSFKSESIPANLNSLKEIINEKIEINGEEIKITAVSIGNPHCVVFCEKIDSIDVEKIGSEISKKSIFPEGVNVEFAEICGKNAIKFRVCERGSGETLACGTGACAVAAAAVKNGLASNSDEISVKALGGELKISFKEEAVFLAGEAVFVYEGVIEI